MKAVQKMKCGKYDSLFNIVSDQFVNAPPELFAHLAQLIRLFITHGFVPESLLICTLFPLVKDNLGDMTKSENYRAIAGGSLLLKVIDLVIIELESDKLSYDELQYAYQQQSSTVMCSWSVTTVVNYFNRRGATVYGAAMDMSKAFDMVNWHELYSTLRKRSINPLLLRLMLNIYKTQKCNVEWNGEKSSDFKVSNGVRQGAVISAIFFAIYINDLLETLRAKKIGCHIDGVYFGAQIFADDIFLLSGNISGLQEMINVCSDFANQKNLKFGTNQNPEKSKTKCIAFSKRSQEIKNLRSVNLDGNPLPWVSSVKHLGNLLQSDNSMKMDISIKRGAFIGRVNSLLQEFRNIKPSIMINLINAFASSMYGSCLWFLLSDQCERLYKAWNVMVRTVFGLDRTTHRRLLEPLSECLHIKPALLSRYLKFCKTLASSRKFSIRYLAKITASDNSTDMGKTLNYIAEKCNVKREDVLCITPKVVKTHIKYCEIDQTEHWKIPI